MTPKETAEVYARQEFLTAWLSFGADMYAKAKDRGLDPLDYLEAFPTLVTQITFLEDLEK